MPPAAAEPQTPSHSADAQPAPESGQRVSPAAVAVSAQPSADAGQPASGQRPDGAASDFSTLKENPEFVKWVNQTYVDPAIGRVDFNRSREREKLRAEVAAEIRDQIAAQQQAQRVDDLLTRVDSQNEAESRAALKELAAHLKTDRAQKHQLNERAQLERQAVNAIAERLFGVDPLSIPADVVGDLDKLRRYLAEQSPSLRQLADEQRTRAEANAREVDQAKGAAGYAETLGQMQNPHLGGAGAPASAQAAMTQAEWDANRKNPAWRRQHRERILRGVEAGQIRY